ncbi:MAG: efflux RND transporter periplasmic adaptor subunit [Desulfobacteraceae bacterium]|nr:efflux RND transporter periplasmic adaptor subunit [Desulfobacteraceae bacterium]
MKKIIFAILLLVIAGGGFAFYKTKLGKGDEQKYRTDKAIRGDIVEAITATGTVNPISTVIVGTQVSGKIQYIYADYNSPVKKGQIIAQIDPTTFEANAEQARANLLVAEANLKKTEASLIDAKRTMERNKELFAKDLIARSDFDTADTNYLSLKAQVAAAKAQIAQAAAALKVSETNLAYTKILSPVDGIIVSRLVEVGQTVAASFQTPTLFNIAEDLTKMQIDSNVNEADIGKVGEGLDVDFTVDAYPDITFKGKVWQVRNSPIIVQNVVTYDVVIRVDNTDLRLKPGMTANTSVITNKKEKVLKIPNAALRFKPPEKTEDKTARKGLAVWITDNKKPVRIPIQIGISDGNYTELVSGDIREDQEIIVEMLNNANTGSQGSGRPPRFF